MDYTTSSNFLSPELGNPAPASMPVAPVTLGDKEQVCHVCGDRTEVTLSSKGVLRCKTCRQFFTRCYYRNSIPRPCDAEEKCVINVQTRSKCRDCRFQKCLAVGMTKEDHVRTPHYSVHVTPLSPMPASSSTPMPSNGEGIVSNETSNRHLAPESSICQPYVTLPIQEICDVCDRQARYKMTSFGVSCCASCYHFFRRVCDMDMENNGKLLEVCLLRNCKTEGYTACRSCRYEKCLRKGMTPKQLETIDVFDRTMLLNLYSNYLPTPNGETPAQNLSEEAISMILNYLFTFEDSQQYMEYKNPSNSGTHASASLEFFLCAWEQFSFEIEYGIRKLCDFFNTIPEFVLLTQEEIIFLLKKNFFVIFLIRVSRNVSFGLWKFHGGSIGFPTLEILFGVTVFPGSCLARKIVTFLLRLRTEYEEWQLALLVPFLFLQNTGHHENLEKVNEYFQYVLLKNMNSRPNSIPYLIGNVLPEINHINLEFEQILNTLRDNVESIELSPMFMELASIENRNANHMVHSEQESDGEPDDSAQTPTTDESGNQTSDMHHRQLDIHGDTLD